MKVGEAKEIFQDILGCDTFEEVLEGIVCDRHHNQLLCLNEDCGECHDIEPDVYETTCPDCGHKAISATALGGI